MGPVADGIPAAVAFGRFGDSLRWDRLPPALRARVRLHVLDTLGVMMAGIAMEVAGQLRGVVRGWGGTPRCLVVGTGSRLPAHNAAFLNAFHARLHVMDDTFDTGPVHPGNAVVSAALAMAEATGAAGARFLTGVLLGYEVANRVSAAISPSHYAAGFHNTGTCNAFAAAAAAAYVGGADADGIAHAIALAGQAAAGTRQFQHDGSISDTALNGARAAQTGVVAAEMGHAGLRGPLGILDGSWGFCRIMAPSSDVGLLTAGLGADFLFSRTAIKLHATCRFTHGPIDLLRGLCRQHAIDHRDIEAVEIATFQESAEVDDRPDPQTRHDAIFSHQYAAAVAILRGRVEMSDLDDDTRGDEDVRALVRRVRVIHDPALDRPATGHLPHRVLITLKGGCRWSAETGYETAPEVTPPDAGSVLAKFMSHAVPVLGFERAEAIPAVLHETDAEPSLARLLSYLVSRPVLAGCEDA